MDTVTHIVLGACIGEVVLGQKIGKKALIAGAVAQSIPDIDFISAFWLSPAQQLLAHRGITHSFLFIALMAPVLATAVHRPLFRNVKLTLLTSFLLLEMLVHIFLDAFNNYGVGWFEPFTNYRVSFNAVYVADILMISVPLISCLALFLVPVVNKNRLRWARAGITWTFLYLGICIFNKLFINGQISRTLADSKMARLSFITTPAPLQNMLWMVVAGDGKGYYVGYRSVFDQNPKPNFSYFPMNEYLLDSLSDHREVDILKQFSQHLYTVEKWTDTIVFNDLRFGQIIGWHDPKERFVFHYFLHHKADNRLVVQRGRFAKWDRHSIASFIRRLKGN
jgi:inner membrane protein